MEHVKMLVLVLVCSQKPLLVSVLIAQFKNNKHFLDFSIQSLCLPTHTLYLHLIPLSGSLQSFHTADLPLQLFSQLCVYVYVWFTVCQGFKISYRCFRSSVDKKRGQLPVGPGERERAGWSGAPPMSTLWRTHTCTKTVKLIMTSFLVPIT